MSKIKLSEITEAITFTPSSDEFKEPLDYVEKIRPIAEKYGICKIIPPNDWKPPFAIDMYNFKFRPRVQRLNELEANSRIKLNFLEKLTKFWELQGKKFRSPTVEGKPLDIYKIYKMVEQLGGYENVTKNKRWAYLVKQLNYKDAYTCTTVKSHYENLLYPFILFEAGVTLPTNETVKNLDLPPETENQKKKKRKSKLDEEKIEQIKCLVCSRGDDEAFMLLCDGCDDSYHTFCLYPPLKEIPKGDWRCPVCVAEICKKPTDEYGFGQSKNEYNLTEFGKMANKFKSEYFRKSLDEITPEECENEFWKILSNPDEVVEVEYGADLHTLETGSGFPTKSHKGKYKESHEPYIDSPWNLNNLSLLSKSVLSQINVDISGMKIPWAYVGMCFSCFCWHVEDHWSYSINYLHMGDIKTWYGVSGLDAEKFELVMKEKAPELFEKSPDLLHHLVTIMNPVVLQDNGCPIYKVNQKAGEFVITFPRAYHAGFNQGFNFAEAVNFCPADWMTLGRAAIENYKLVKRHTVFSHDELVCKLALNKECIDLNISLAIQNELKIMIDHETKDRKFLLEKGIKNARRIAFEQFTDDERTCDYCKTTCFVSALTCSCKQEKLVCLNHYEHLCDYSTKSGKITQNQTHRLTILYRYEMQELVSMYTRLKQKTDEYFKWCNQVKSLLGLKKLMKSDSDSDILEDDDDIITSKKPHIRTFMKLYQEARDKQFPVQIFMFNKTKINLFKQLEDELNMAINVAKTCKKYLSIFKNSKSNELGEGGSDDEIIFVKKTKKERPYLDNLKNLLSNLDKLKCDLDEGDLFRTLVLESVRNETKIKDLIREWNLENISEIKSTVDYLDRIEIEFPLSLVEQLRLMYKQAIWLDKVNKMTPETVTINLLQDYIDEFVNESLMCSMGVEEKKYDRVQKNFVDLQELLNVAQSCNDRAKKILEMSSNGNKNRLEELENLLNESKSVPVKMENVIKIEDIVKKAKVWIQQANEFIKGEPHLNDLKDCLKQSGELPIQFDLVPVLQTRINLFTEWLFKLDTTFFKSDSTKTILDILTPRLDLEHFIHKLQNSLKACTNQASSPVLSEVTTSKYLTKRQREKNEKNNSSLNTSKLDMSFEIPIESTLEFYSNELNLTQLIEKYKCLQFKEIDLIKQCRRLNIERILQIKNYLNNVIQNPNEPICLKENPLNKIKCTSCTSSILNRIFTSSQFNQCKLCQGLFCSVCNNVNLKQSKLKMAESTSFLCPLCDRSKRPKLDLVVDFLIKFEKLQIKSYESNALQMFVNRALNWNERFDKLVNECDEVKKCFEIFENCKNHENYELGKNKEYSFLFFLQFSKVC
ncbi:unnamed protein product [Brachionus calyciflorus]|uniref:[histone H3]-trimethyl-L-lysine(4) demethylase n=1 Tax=Brachionus calyciflorus TaxID=104777 RepID=A0A813V1P7_9BILA|nr:unnamed protein product [Brachionus calyciflorus]